MCCHEQAPTSPGRVAVPCQNRHNKPWRQSKKSIKTSQADIEKVRARLGLAEEIHKAGVKQKEESDERK